MSVEFFLRIIFMILLGIAGGIWGHDLARYNPPEVFRYTSGTGAGRRLDRPDPDAVFHHAPGAGLAQAAGQDRGRDALCGHGRPAWSAC